MSLEIIDRVLEWLSFFLYQQDFNWAWDSWSFVGEQPDDSIQKVFVRILLTKCYNLTDPKALYDNLPEALQNLVNLNKSPVFAFVTESKDNYDAQEILEEMNTRELSKQI